LLHHFQAGLGNGNEPMNILVMGNGSGFGGAQTAFRSLIGFLQLEGHRIGSISITDESEDIPNAGSLALYRRIDFQANTGARGIRKCGRTVVAAAAARKFGPNLFIAIGLSHSANLVARFLPSSCYRICQDFVAGRSLDDPYFESSTRYFDAVAHQAPSMTRSWIEKGFKRKPLNWLPCFPVAPIEGLRRADRPERTSIRIAYFGRLAPNKGLGLFFEAIAHVELPIPLEVHIWGSGPDRERLESCARTLGLTGTVSFKGSYPTEAAGAALMCSYDALVLPSIGSEGLPLILLEAMAYGIPVLATDVGAIRDCCLDNPDFLLTNATADGLISGVNELARRLMNNDLDTRRLQAYYTHHFSHDAMAQRWRKCLRSPTKFFKYGE
jgi:glycosyltransferase involved in cell wall biosynthesis